MASLTATVDQIHAAISVIPDLNILGDSFSRTVSNGWGVTDTGQTWSAIGTASDYAVSAGVGTHSVGSLNTARITYIGSPTLTDLWATVRMFIPAVATVAPARSAIILRDDGTGANHYRVECVFGLAGVLSVSIVKRVAGTDTQLATASVSGTYIANTQVHITAQISGTHIWGKAWREGDVEPGYQVTYVDNAPTVAGRFGFRSLLDTGNTNTLPMVFSYDNVDVDSTRDPVSIYRVTPDGTETRVLGTPVVTSNATAVVWDTQPPLDTPVYYEASSMTSGVLLTSSTVTVTGQGAGWLKDPLLPSNDLHLTSCPPGGCSTQGGITLATLGDEAFGNRSGLFDLIGSARPRAVAEVRGSQEGELRILTHSLTDRDAVEDLVAPGRVQLWQVNISYGWRTRAPYYGTDHVAVLAATAGRPPSANQTRDQREWHLGYRVTTPPRGTTGLTAGNGIGVIGARYQDRITAGTTYAAATATGRTYLQRALGAD